MCEVNFHTKFHMPNSTGSLVIAIKRIVKYTFHTTFGSLTCYKRRKLIKVAYSSGICQHTQLQGPTLRGGRHDTFERPLCWYY
jgi:hypothetical protein